LEDHAQGQQIYLMKECIQRLARLNGQVKMTSGGFSLRFFKGFPLDGHRAFNSCFLLLFFVSRISDIYLR
jgi:hypothetical protein